MQASLDEDADLRLVALHQAALLHSGGAWAESEAAFVRAGQAIGYAPLAVEAELIARLRATNVLALKQNPAPLTAALPSLDFKPPRAGTGALTVVFERGAAPRGQVTYVEQSHARQVSVSRETTQVPARWQVDDEAAATAELVDSTAARWSTQVEARLRASLGNLGAGLTWQSEWWTPPSDWLVGQRELFPGRHVVTVTTASGRRARAVEIVAGQRVFLVVPQ
jgi:uncharacterized protein YbdZ (MbtH family)